MPPLPALQGDAQKYFLRFFAESTRDIWFAAAIRPVSGCIAVNATFRPRSDPAFDEARDRIERMRCGGWPLQLQWCPMRTGGEPFHQVEIRCLADLYDEGEWPEQHRWLARHLLSLWRTVGQGIDPVNDQMILSQF